MSKSFMSGRDKTVLLNHIALHLKGNCFFINHLTFLALRKIEF